MEHDTDFLSGLMSNVVKDLNEKKEELLISRILEKTGQKIDLIKEYQKRFPRISCVHNASNNTEKWFWNDGSEKGLLLITFYFELGDFSIDDGRRISASFRYL